MSLTRGTACPDGKAISLAMTSLFSFGETPTFNYIFQPPHPQWRAPLQRREISTSNSPLPEGCTKGEVFLNYFFKPSTIFFFTLITVPCLCPSGIVVDELISSKFLKSTVLKVVYFLSP